LVKAFNLLSVKERRETYDDELFKSRERETLVVGRPERKVAISGGTIGGGAVGSSKQAQAPMPRQKTEPTAGSTRQGKMRTAQPGNAGFCAQEWKGIGSGATVLKALTDAVTEEEKISMLYDKYQGLPRGKKKKKDWCDGLLGHQKFGLKALAKEKELEKLNKWGKWLACGPKIAQPKFKGKAPPRANLKKKPDSAAADGKDTEEHAATEPTAGDNGVAAPQEAPAVVAA